MCCFFFVSLLRPSPSRQLGQVQATLLILRPGVPSEPDAPVASEAVTVVAVVNDWFAVA